MPKRLFSALFVVGAFSLRAQTVAPPYSADYVARNLGSIPNVPSRYGGLTLSADAPDTLLIGGDANNQEAKIYAVQVSRGPDNHISGFKGPATVYAAAGGIPGSGGGIDGGLAYGPGKVLFFTSFDDNSIGQLKPGSRTVDRRTPLAALGIAPSVGSLNFVPASFPGAGRLKILSYDTGAWYDTTVSPRADGTFDIQPPTKSVVLVGSSPEGVVYIAKGNPQFTAPSVLVSDFDNGLIAAYEVDDNGDPVLATRRIFMEGLEGAEGAAVDPVTGDFLFSTFGGGDKLVVVRGFHGSIPNKPPTVALTLPVSGTVFAAGANIAVSASAADTDGAVRKVEFYSGTTLLGSASLPPFQIVWPNVPAGDYILTAVATDDQNAATVSALVSIRVQGPNQPPRIAIDAPSPNSTLTAGGDVAVWASASDADGAIIRVDFFVDSVKIGQALNSPYSVVWSSAPAGTHVITARAFDDAGGSATSTPVQVNLTPKTGPILSVEAYSAADGFQLALAGEVGKRYSIEATTDFVAWREIVNFVATSGSTTIVDGEAPKHLHQCYRAKQLN